MQEEIERELQMQESEPEPITQTQRYFENERLDRLRERSEETALPILKVKVK